MFFFFNDPATTEIYTLSLHDALPIFLGSRLDGLSRLGKLGRLGWLDRLGRRSSVVHWKPELRRPRRSRQPRRPSRSEEHTAEIQSLAYFASPPLLGQTHTR